MYKDENVLEGKIKFKNLKKRVVWKKNDQMEFNFYSRFIQYTMIVKYMIKRFILWTENV